MKRTLSALLLLAISAILVPAVHADDGCTNATLTGSYSYNVRGWFPTVDSKGHLILQNSTIADFVGVASFDGAGNATTAFTLCTNGACSKQHGQGTYKVNSDCSGTFLFGKGKNPNHWSLAISNGGNQIYLVETDGSNVSGPATKQ